MDQTFFGLTSKDRPQLHSNLFDLLWLGEGRWDWETLYHMPIYLRSFYIKKIEKLYNDKKEAQEKLHSGNKSSKKIEKGPF